ARHHQLTPAADDLVLMVAQVGGHSPLAAVYVHAYAFLYIRLRVTHVPANSTSAHTAAATPLIGHTIWMTVQADTLESGIGRAPVLDRTARCQRGRQRAGRA